MRFCALHRQANARSAGDVLPDNVATCCDRAADGVLSEVTVEPLTPALFEAHAVC